MNRDQLIARLASLRPELEARGIAHLAIFGSRARGDERQASDLDMLIEVRPQARFSLLELIGVERFVSKATGIEAVGAMRRSIPGEFSNRIADDIIEVF
jgi:predicted nucleotidyltransferase